MYDTVCVTSPEIDDEMKKIALSRCNVYKSYCYETGEEIYEFTTGTLDASYDYRIRFAVEDFHWERENTLLPVKVKTYWHLTIECSLHKLMMNHNVFGGPTKIKESIKHLLNFVEEKLNITLPDYKEWIAEQIDVSRIYEFNNKKICEKIISNLKNSYYSRRKPRIFDTSVMFSGSTSTNKFYWKGPEFIKHDFKRLKKHLTKKIDESYSKDDGDMLRQRYKWVLKKYENIKDKAMNIIRFECSIKKRKLKNLFKNDIVKVKMLDDDLLKKCMTDELKKIIKENDDMNIVRRSDLVLERLINVHGKHLGNILFGTWTQLVHFGEVNTKESIAKATLNRHKKFMQDCGVAWNTTSINLRQFSIVPEDFSFLSDKYANDEVAPEVLEKLKLVS